MQVGAAFGSGIGEWLKVSAEERRLLMLAGAGAGLGAVFRAPLGGALFVVEVLYREIDFEAPALVPCFVASIVAYSIFCGINGTWGSLFSVPPVKFSHPLQLPFYVALGLVCALVGMLYVKVFYGLRDHVFHKLPLPNYIKPAVGGLAVGVIGFFLPQVLGQGYGWVQLAMDGRLPLALVIAVPFLKILATGLTISSGGSGGTFAPSMVIGGFTGAAMGMILHQWLPAIVPNPAVFALVGMAGFLAGVAKTPLASLIMISEMTTGYGLLVPLMLTTASGYVFARKKISIYENQVGQRIDSPAHEGEFVTGALERILIKDALQPSDKLITFHHDTMLAEILKGAAATRTAGVSRVWRGRTALWSD